MQSKHKKFDCNALSYLFIAYLCRHTILHVNSFDHIVFNYLRMRNLIYHIILWGNLWYITILASCAYHEPDRFQEVRAVMTSNPPKALKLITKYRLSANSTAADSAYYALLLSQARYHNQIDEYPDSMLNNCVQYMCQNGSVDDYATALFLYGHAKNLAGNHADAAVLFAEGANVAHNSELHLTEALCSRALFELYSKLFNGDLQLKYATAEYEAYVKANDSAHINSAKYDIAIAQVNSHQYATAIKLAKEVYADALHANDSVLAGKAAALLGQSYTLSRQYHEALNHYNASLKLKHYSLTRQDRYCLAIIFHSMSVQNIPHNLQPLRDSILNMEPEQCPFEILAAQGKYKEAFESCRRCYTELDGTLHNLLTKKVHSSVQNHFEQEEQREKSKVHQERILLSLLIIILLSISVAVFVIYRRRLTNQKLSHEALLAETSKLTKDLARLQLSTDTFSAYSREIFRQRFDIVNKLSAAYYEAKGTSYENKMIVKEVESILNGLKSDSSALKELETYSNKYGESIIEKFKSDFPDIRPEEIRLFLYTVIGFSARSISLFMDEKVSVIYNRKSRLKNKIKESEATHKEEYLKYFT